MIAYAYFNIKKPEYDKFVYKIIPLRRFQNILLSKQMGFVNPSLWNDPYENFLLNQTFKIQNGEEKTFKELTNTLYGSCWTFNHNTDFGWKVYLKDEIGVQIKTKISRLYNHFHHLKSDPNLATFQVGKVSYMKWKPLKSTYEKRGFNAFLFLMNESSFMKRQEYVHEKEVRILLRYHNHADSVLSLDFDVNSVSKTIMLDPRLSYIDYELEKEKLIRLGYKGRIYRSTLYTPPRLNLDYKNITSNKADDNI
jgi:hypothetical protein